LTQERYREREKGTNHQHNSDATLGYPPHPGLYVTQSIDILSIVHSRRFNSHVVTFPKQKEVVPLKKSNPKK
jgi:hypothetical protein